MDRLRKIRLPHVMTAGLLALTMIALIVSAQGLYHVADQAEVPSPWLWPALVDLVGITMSLAVWRAGRLNLPAPWARLGLYAVTLWSIGCQVVSAPENTGARLVHGWAPLAVLVVFELLLWTVGLEERAHEPMSPPVTVDERRIRAVSDLPLIASAGECVPLDPHGDWVTTDPEREETLAAAARILATGREVNGVTLADELGVSRATGKRRRARWITEIVLDGLEARA